MSKLYRFAPTRELRADYDALVPTTVKARKHAKELREYLKRREQENVTGENASYIGDFVGSFVNFVRDRGLSSMSAFS